MTQSTYSENNVGKHGNASDRRLGEYWEAQFITMCKDIGWEAWPFAKKKGPAFYDPETKETFISPDVWILRRGDRQYACEVKHKCPTKTGAYGLEKYRADSLLSLGRLYRNQFGPVTSLYVIHNHALSGGRDCKINNILHWQAQTLETMQQNISGTWRGPTYWAGGVIEAEIHYYKTEIFIPAVYFLDSVSP